MQDSVHAYTAGKNYHYYTILNIKAHPDRTGRLWPSKFAGICPVTGRRYPAGAMMRWTLNVETGEAVVLPQETMVMLEFRGHDGRERPDLEECFITGWRFGGVEQIGFELASYGHQQIEMVEILHESGKVSRWQLFDEKSRKAAERSIKKSNVIAYKIQFKLSVLADLRREELAALVNRHETPAAEAAKEV